MKQHYLQKSVSSVFNTKYIHAYDYIAMALIRLSLIVISIVIHGDGNDAVQASSLRLRETSSLLLKNETAMTPDA